MLINIVFKNPNWLETDQLAIFKEQLNPRCSRVGGLNPGAPEEKSSALNRSASLAALATKGAAKSGRGEVVGPLLAWLAATFILLEHVTLGKAPQMLLWCLCSSTPPSLTEKSWPYRYKTEKFTNRTSRGYIFQLSIRKEEHLSKFEVEN